MKNRKRLVAWITALLLMVNLVPVTSLADTSEVYGASGEDSSPTATQQIQSAIDGNMDSPFVAVTNVTVSPSDAAVPTGEWFHYTVFYMLKPAPVYYPDPASPASQPCYTQYDQVVFTLTPPANIELSGANLTDHGDGTYSYRLLNQYVLGGGISGNDEISARMTNNGDAADHTAYGSLGVSVTADVTAADSGSTMTFTQVPVSGNVTAIENAASGAWSIQKTADEDDPSVDRTTEEVTFAYTIEIGRTDEGGALLKNDASYDVTGALKFSAFTLTDTPAAFTDIDGNSVSPLRWTAVPLDGAGLPVTAQAQSGTAATITLTDYRTIHATGTAGGVTVSGAETAPVALPTYTQYAVTVTYPLQPLTAPYEEPDRTFAIANAATLAYTLVGQDASAETSSAGVTYGLPTDPGYLTVSQYLHLDGEARAYDAFYQAFFPGATYAVYPADAFDALTGTPTGSAAETFEITDRSQTTGALKPGVYYVVQTAAPADRNTLTPLPLVDAAGDALAQNWQAVNVDGDGSSTQLSFYNKVSGQGLLKVKKTDSDGAALAGVTFTLIPDGGGDGYQAVTDTDGVAYLLAPAGAYTLRETAPAGYIRAEDRAVTIAEGSTLDWTGTPIVNVPNTASLNINKYAVLYARGDHAYGDDERTEIGAVAGVDTTAFSFTLEYATDNTFPESGTAVRQVTLSDGQSAATVTSLPRTAPDGVTYYWYRLTENASGDAAFTKDSFVYTWQFQSSDSQTCDFYNQLHSTLTFAKVQQNLSEDGLGSVDAPDAGRGFTLYRKNADGTFSQAGDTLNTGSDGKATTGYLPIRDENGPIEYYLAETPIDGYAVTYPTAASITADSATIAAWGPILLAEAKTTDKSGTPILNRQRQGQILLYKRQTGHTVNLANAAFSVYYYEPDDAVTKHYVDGSDATPFVTTAEGVLVNHLPVGYVYYIQETAAPDGYRLDATPNPDSVAVTEPLQQSTLYFYDNRKPTLTVVKTVLDPTAAATVRFSGTFGFSLYRWTGTDMQPVADFAAVTAANATSQSTAPMVVEENGSDYYVAETLYPDNLIPPEVVNNTDAGQIVGGVFYYRVSELSDNGTVTLNLQNKLNAGKLVLQKKNAKTNLALAGATFRVSVANPDVKAQALLALQGFAADPADAALFVKTVALGAATSATLTRLPVVNADGSKLVYSVVETAAPSGFRLPDDNAPRTYVLADLTRYTATSVYADPPYATLKALKLYYKEWESKNNLLLYPLAGAKLALYLVKDGALAYVNGSETPVGITDASGQALFENLDGTKTYMVVEMEPPTGYELPTGKSGVSAYADIIGTSTADALSAYNAKTYDLNDAANNAYLVDQDGALQNTKPYAQFRITKVDADNPSLLLNKAKFTLYSCAQATLDEYAGMGLTGAALFAAIRDAGLMTHEAYTYETGTGLTSDGAAAAGVFQTKPLEYGLAYWFYETTAPEGTYEISETDNPYGPFTSNGSHGDTYAHNAITEKTFTNRKETGGTGGEGNPIRYLQIQINKKLLNEDGDFIKNLAGVNFEVYLADADYQPTHFLTTFTTGLDTSVTDYASVAGRGISETLEFSALYASYPTLVSRTPQPDGSTFSYQYQANFVIKETGYPSNVSPRGVYYPLTVNTADSAAQTIEDHTYDMTDSYDHSILNVLAHKAPVRIRKVGYTVPLTAESVRTPLEGVQIGIYSDAGCLTLVASATTDELGYANFVLEPNTHFWYREMLASGAYDLNATVYDFLTGDYGADLQTYVMEDPAYRVLNLNKHRADGTQVEGAQLRVVRAADEGAIRDTNGTILPAGADTLTTPASGYTQILLPYSINGDYGVLELSVPGDTLTTADQLNFKLANQHAGLLPVRFAVDEAEKAVSLVNPDRAHLMLTKVDDAGTPMADVAFTVSFKSFALADLDASVTATADSGWAAVGIWTTDAEGKIDKTGLTAGWYKLVETLPAGYVDEGVAARTLVVKMTARAIGQEDDAPVTAQVTNVRKGYLTVSKRFEGDLLQPLPSSVVFSVFTDAACLTPASPASVTVPISGGSGGAQAAFDPGTYYLTEAGGAWYGKYSLNGGDEQWVNGAVEWTVASHNTADAPVTLSIVNKPSQATVTLRKVDDDGQNIAGAKFTLDYLSGGDRYYYHDATRLWTADPAGRAVWTTGADGLATLLVTLPFARLMADESAVTYNLREVEAPAELEFAADRAVELSQDANVLDITDEPLVDHTGLYISLTKYGRAREHATPTDTLAGAGFTLYLWNGSTAVEQATLLTAADGTLMFPNLKRLSGGQYYAIAETTTPSGFVEGLVEVTLNDVPVEPVEVSVGGEQRKLFVVAQDQTVALQAYNTPAGKLAILKYNYLEPDSSVTGDVPHYAIFSVSSVDEQDDVIATVTDRAIVTYWEESDPATLEGGIQKDGLSGLYLDADGCYYASRVVGNLAPGRYLIHEETQADHFYYTPNSAPTDPWYPTQYAQVDNDGGVTVSTFANIPKPDAPKIGIDKTLLSVNGDTSATVLPSLQEGWQKVTYRIAGFARATDGQPIQLPTQWLELSDHELVFADRHGSAVTGVEHYTLSVTVGKAMYEATALNPSPGKELLYASVYGIAEDGTETLVATRNVTEAGQKVAFPENTYVGFRVRYGVSNDGSMDTGLKAGFTADPVTAEMLFRQENDATVTPVATIGNTAAVRLKYNLGGIDSVASGWTADAASVSVEPEPPLPKVSITKTCDKSSVKPQDVITYTVELINVSTDGTAMTDPVLIDHVPTLLEYGLSNVTWSTLPAGMTADAPVTNGEYVYVRFHGELPAGSSIRLYLRGTVRTVAEASSSFSNTAYVTSDSFVHCNTGNPSGTSFTDRYGNLPDEAGALPGSVIGGDAETYRTLSVQTTNTMIFNNQVTLFKMASADLSGLDVYKGAESYAIASTSDDGTANIRYRLVLRNDGQKAIENIRLIDKLPVIGDKEIASSTSRDSRWPVAFVGVLDSSASDYTLYTTNVAEVSGGGTSNYIDDITTGDLTDWSTGTAGYDDATCIRLDFGPSVVLQPGEKLTLTLACRAPSTEEAMDGSAANSGTYYFWLANDTAAACTNQTDVSTRAVVYSARASVLLNPALVSLGNRIWVDRNMNGLQDVADAAEVLDDPDTVFALEPSYTAGSDLRFTLRTYTGSDVSYTTQTAAPDAKGFYAFAGLYPGRIKTASLPTAYDDAGNILNSSLFGMRPTSYQLLVSGIPEGYLVSRVYANNGGAYAPHYELNTLAERQNDNNFQSKTGGFASERFYLPVGEDNPTFDLGLIRYRNLSITKRGTDGNLLDGAQFAIYGPFTDVDLAAPVDLAALTPVATLTTSSGAATFTSTSATHCLNYYSHYIVVETVGAETWYAPEQLQASGAHVAAASGYTAVSGGGVTDGNFFVLLARDDTDTDGLTDAVTVTNEYVASGSLQVVGVKTVVGEALAADQFAFVLSSTDDPGFTTATVINDAAGHFAFPALTYGFSDAGHTYHYTVTERNDGVKGITYDASVYRLTVTLYNLGDGVLDVVKQLTDGDGNPCDSVAFQNESKGTLRIQKTLAGNAPVAGDRFSFTVTLTDRSGDPVTGTFPCVHSGDASLTSLTPDASGQLSLTLGGGETVALSGLISGTRYLVQEADYAAQGYATEAIDPAGTIATDEDINDVLFTNTRNLGNLTVSKTLAGTAPDTAKQFRFEIALTNAAFPVDGTYACVTTGDKTQSSLTFASGKATVELAGGQSITVVGLYAGTDYTVTEADESAGAYTPAPVSRAASGTVAACDADATGALAAFTNRRDAASLTVQKTLAGNATDPDKAFTFQITLTGAGGVEVNRAYPCAAGSAVTSVTFAHGKASVALKGGEHATITDIPVGTAYSVAEVSYAADGYQTVLLPDADVHTLTQDGATVTAVNTRNTYGALVISKAVAGAAADAGKAFDFSIRLERTDTLTVDGDYVCQRTQGATGASAEETLTVTGGMATVSLRADESFSIPGILTGTAYTVTEADYRGEGYYPTPTGGVRTGVIYDVDQTYTAAFLNTRGAGKLVISKTANGNAANPDQDFAFEVLFTREDSISVDGVYECDLSTSSGVSPLLLTVSGGKADVTLKHGQSLTIKAILKDTSYAVTEKSYVEDGYYTTPSSRVSAGKVQTDDQVCAAAFVNTRNVGTLSVTKTLAGNGASATRGFLFTVTLTRADRMPVDGVYTCDLTANGIAYPTALTVSGGRGTFSLTGGQTMAVYGIPTDTTYAVAESSYTGEGYTTHFTASGGTIGTGVSAAAFTNTRTVGSLTVRKALAGNAPETERAFTFTIRLFDRSGRAVNGTLPATGAYGSLTFTGGAATARLKGGERVTLPNLLTGWSYSVTEAEANMEGYQTSATGTAGVIGTQDSAAVFTNERNRQQAFTRLAVTKTWNDDDNKDALRPATVTVYLLADGTATQRSAVSLATGWACAFESLPVFNADGTEIEYRVLEEAIPGYHAQYAYGLESVTITNTHTSEVFKTQDESGETIWTAYGVPLGTNMNLNEGDCID